MSQRQCKNAPPSVPLLMSGRKAWRVSGEVGSRACARCPRVGDEWESGVHDIEKCLEGTIAKEMLGLLLWNSNIYHSNTNRTVMPVVDSSLCLHPAVCHRILAPAVNLEERSILLLYVADRTQRMAPRARQRLFIR